MSKVRVELRADLERKLARTSGMQQTMDAIASVMAERVKANAPFERIAERIDHTSGIDAEGAFGRVRSWDWISHFWEFGTANHDARPFMRPVAESIGTLQPRRQGE